MITVSPAAPVDVEEATAVLAGAFRDDPVMSAFVGGDPDERERRLTHLLGVLVRTGLSSGAVDLARAEEGPAVLGVAVWSAPGNRDDGLLHTIRNIGSYLRAFGPGGLRRAARLQRAIDSARPGEAHWYLGAIGATPAGRGRGIGSALLRARLETIEAPAYLEASTERSAALYARFGFDRIGTVAGFPEPVRPVAMWRPGAPVRPGRSGS
ncbi:MULTISPECIES: GNAT family N-acetyltransferase [Pseudonocardia]|uniref:Acetyltransferase (GNAT) family protein n=2 Tax=Pseudonocardia TaxID=1847 RepID=A0A1Y2MRR9_PSEAH|nr:MULTISPECIES: GNAT family N-acetyltransferase [Pseudonocardia]OSY37198.1 Acetyltransferase (GNAT) family protein [Pseudonocardia autotrophica]TDN74819.1 acetyltransferase (GNAT) family protein [Pseudonocardia autotrophica]BBG05594.1 GCN5-like N-acetyltransferase [Pseudonocardia autotrophica]GEC25845.1 GCN5-like N-acetyltransferase [Pseudonocardia saturnea]